MRYPSSPARPGSSLRSSGTASPIPVPAGGHRHPWHARHLTTLAGLRFEEPATARPGTASLAEFSISCAMVDGNLRIYRQCSGDEDHLCAPQLKGSGAERHALRSSSKTCAPAQAAPPRPVNCRPARCGPRGFRQHRPPPLGLYDLRLIFGPRRAVLDLITAPRRRGLVPAARSSWQTPATPDNADGTSAITDRIIAVSGGGFSQTGHEPRIHGHKHRRPRRCACRRRGAGNNHPCWHLSAAVDNLPC